MYTYVEPEGKPGRIPEVDILRGIALLMMVVYHTAFDLNWLGIAPVPAGEGAWRCLALLTASLFAGIAGVSVTLQEANIRARGGDIFAVCRVTTKRGLFILAVGILITVVTALLPSQWVIHFGILHLIGISVILAPLFIPLRSWNFPVALVILAAGVTATGTPGPAFLLPLGIHPASYSSPDYTPLLPWLGVVMLGSAAGSFLYPGGKRRYSFKWSVPSWLSAPCRLLGTAGRHTLLIYVLHQPMIVIVLLLLTGQTDLLAGIAGRDWIS